MSDPSLEMSPDARAEQPRVIGDRYEVIRVLGEGSSACTLLCSDLQDERRVAVKELHFEHLDNWKYLELFEREAKVLSLLEHDGIPKVLDYFQARSSATTLYIVQEFIEGASLTQRMESGPLLGELEVYDLTLGLLDVLEYLHGRAPPVFHRDIKPSNVLIRPNGDAALVDFGGVCFGWRPPSHAGTTVVGTFGYMPPEQLLGQGGPTADLYSLGATLLHLVTGRPPNEFPFDSGRIEVPTDLPIRDSLTRLIDALLRPAPRDRPQTAAAARQILTDHVQEKPTTVAGATVVSPPGSVRRSGAIVTGDGPRFVDMGPPPRDPHGEFEDVYWNLVHPLWGTWSQTAFAQVLYGIVFIATLGVAPLLYAMRQGDRKRRSLDLFQRGEFTSGHIIAAITGEGEVTTRFKYEFEVAGSSYIAFMDYRSGLGRYWGEGDPVPVLYDPDDPTKCCFVYRWKGLK